MICDDKVCSVYGELIGDTYYVCGSKKWSDVKTDTPNSKVQHVSINGMPT